MARRPNVLPILVKNYSFLGAVFTAQQLDDFPAPCYLTGPIGAAFGVQVYLANSKQEAEALANVGAPGITFPLRLTRLIGVFAACNSGNGAVLSVVATGEDLNENP